MSVSIQKRNGRYEPYDADKLHHSIVSACLSVKAFEGEAQIIALRVVEHMYTWLQDKVEVTSEDIRRVAATHLESYHQPAAYIYSQQNVML